MTFKKTRKEPIEMLDTADIREILEKKRESFKRPTERSWTSDEDKILLDFWGKKGTLQKDIAKLLEASEVTCRKRFRELTEVRDE